LEREGTWRDRTRYGAPQPVIDFSDSMIFAMPPANVDRQASRRRKLTFLLRKRRYRLTLR